MVSVTQYSSARWEGKERGSSRSACAHELSKKLVTLGKFSLKDLDLPSMSGSHLLVSIKRKSIYTAGKSGNIWQVSMSRQFPPTNETVRLRAHAQHWRMPFAGFSDNNTNNYKISIELPPLRRIIYKNNWPQLLFHKMHLWISHLHETQTFSKSACLIQ